jgi:spore germination cell wall hydrolase CwlJ-like protein
VTQVLVLSRPLDELRRHAARIGLRAGSQAAALWRAYPRETLGAGLLGLVGAAAIGGTFYAGVGGPAHAAPPAPPPLIMRAIAPAQALKVNAELPLTAGPNPAAAPFRFTGGSSARTQALECLASAVYYEAGNQDSDGERAVAQVVLNRVRHPAFPASVCGVVYQGSTRATGCQFTFTCDGSLNRAPDADGWRRAVAVANAALSGAVYAPVGWATHYHADYVVPYWASSLAKNAIVGAHIFYRWAGGWGQPGGFSDHYAGHEPDAAALRTAALSVVHIAPTAPQGDQVAALVDTVAGAEALPLQPSMRGDKRVAIRFNQVARKASAEAPHVDYTQKFEASENLKYALSAETAAANQQPLGKPAAAPSGGGSAIASIER